MIRRLALTALALGMIACASAPPQSPEERLAKQLEWFQDMKFGFFSHWGVYSQWGCIESWPLVEVDKWARPDDLPAWTERGKDIEKFKRDYWVLNKTFNPTKFDPKKWAAAAKAAGMKYFVFTTKHHDGFSMYDTKLTDFRITHPDCPFSKDPRSNVTKLLFDAFRAEGFGIGAYFSKSDWHHPGYWSSDAPAKDRNPNYDTLKNPEKWAGFVKFVHGQIEELMTGYGRVDILWLDGGQVRPPKQDVQMDRLAEMARRHHPDLLIVDRTVHGKYENYRTPEQEVPPKPEPFVWESCITMGDQWSFKPNDKYKPVRALVHLLVDIVAKGGNLLLNVGGQPDGELPAEAVTRLQEIGEWMKVNGEAIYGTRAIAPYKEGRVALTRRGKTVNAICMFEEGKDAPPAKVTLTALRPRAGSKVRLLGSSADIPWRPEGDKGMAIEVPEAVLKAPPSRHAVTFQFEIE